MAQWSKNFTDITNVNNGQEFGINDYPTTDGFNVPINNTQYLYNLLQNGFIKSYTISDGTVTIVTRDVSGNDVTTTMTIATLNGYTKTEIDNMCVKYTVQSLTDAQKNQARLNINAPTRTTSNNTQETEFYNVSGQIGLVARTQSSYNTSMIVNYNDIHITKTDSEHEIVEEFDLIARLESLGFKQGSFTFDTSASITAVSNNLKKQGKYAIGNLAIIVRTTSQNTRVTIKVPNDFKPKQNTDVTFFEFNQLLNAYVVINGVVITTNGEIILDIANTGTFSFGIQNAGWEL